MKKNNIKIYKTVKYPLKINIWGCFYKGKIGSINIFSNNMNADHYIQILENDLLPILEKSKTKLIFQHDNDPKHKSNKTKRFLENSNVMVLNWPSCSPDLNPIENVWKILKDNVRKRKPKNKNEFINIVTDEWKKINEETLKSLIDSMPHRIQQVIENNGDIIMY